MAKRIELVTEFKAVYIPLPPEMAKARRASLLLLLQWVKSDLISSADEYEGRDGE